MDSSRVEDLSDVLDPGEAEAIILAEEINADLLIIDEKAGRKIANQLGLPVIGLLGILIQLKRKSVIEEVKPLLDQLIDEAGFRVSGSLYERDLLAVSEH